MLPSPVRKFPLQKKTDGRKPKLLCVNATKIKLLSDHGQTYLEQQQSQN